MSITKHNVFVNIFWRVPHTSCCWMCGSRSQTPSHPGDIFSPVPTGLKRYYGNHDLHFITSSCYGRSPLLGSPAARDEFLSILERVRRRLRFVMIGYVVMPEHFHLLMSEPENGTPSEAMKRLKHQTSFRLNHEGDHLWQHRFYDFNVWTAKKRIEKLKYMHRNPVKRGLVENPEDWIWSSYRFYLLDEEGPVRINEGWTEIRLPVR